MEEYLTVYVPPANDVAMRGRSPDARVLIVDRSYRLLTVQYPSGRTETFKIRLRTPMNGIEAGDAVAIRPVKAIELRVRSAGMAAAR